jgi:bifunctional non-homologous end joining protein LigD
VSTPLHWDELTDDVRPRDFTMAVTRRRLDEHGDLFAAVLEDPRPLAPAQRALEKLAS